MWFNQMRRKKYERKIRREEILGNKRGRMSKNIKIFSSIGYFSTLIQSVTEFKVIPQYRIA